jgi:hypothetical protein
LACTAALVKPVAADGVHVGLRRAVPHQLDGRVAAARARSHKARVERRARRGVRVGLAALAAQHSAARRQEGANLGALRRQRVVRQRARLGTR